MAVADLQGGQAFAVAVLVFLTQLALALYFLSRPYGERALIPVPKPSGEATLQEGVTIFTVPNFIRLDDETWLRQELAVRSWKSLDPPAKPSCSLSLGLRWVPSPTSPGRAAWATSGCHRMGTRPPASRA